MRTICGTILATAMRRRRSRPRGRAVDRAAMRANRDYVGQLAFRRKVSRDVLGIGGGRTPRNVRFYGTFRDFNPLNDLGSG